MIKKIIIVLFILVGFINIAYADSTVVQSQEAVSMDIKQIVFIITADAGTGAVSNTTMNAKSLAHVKGMYFYEVTAFPTSGGTTPDAADILVSDANGEYLLGSEDGGTTAYQGLNLIHPTRKYSCIPDKYLPRAGGHQPFYPEISGAYTLKIQNQTTGSANITVIFTFVK